FISRVLTDPPEPKAFREAALRILNEVAALYGWMYSAKDPYGNHGMVRHFIWSDVLRCPACGYAVSLWDACVSLEPARIDQQFNCPKCGNKSWLDDTQRETHKIFDEIIGMTIEQRLRKVAWVYGITGKERWSRPPILDDVDLLARIEQ